MNGKNSRLAVTWLLLLAAIASPLASAAAAPKVTPPSPAPAKDVRFPAFAERTLANGLRVVVIEQHEQPLLTLRMVVDAGRAFETGQHSGLAAATAALLTKGTPTRSAQQIAEAIDGVGGTLEASAGVETSRVSLAVTADQIALGFELLADVVLRPTFPDDELERWRRQALGELEVAMDTPSYVADNALLRAVLADHPYGRPPEGTPESLAALTRQDLAAYHGARYVPKSAILAVVGDVAPADAFARVERAFGEWRGGEPATLPAPTASTARRVIVIDKPDAVQTEIRMGQVGTAYRDPDSFVAQVYNSVVGQSASSRLFTEVRKKRGLTYGANSSFVQLTQPGWFRVSTFTKSETTVETLQVALDVLRGMQQAAVPDAELTAAKTYITGALPLQIETADGTASRVLEAMHYGYGREFLESYNTRLSAVTAAEVQRFARERIQPEVMTVVLAGNAAAFAPALEKSFGKPETIPLAAVDFLRGDLRKPDEPAPKPPKNGG